MTHLEQEINKVKQKMFTMADLAIESIVDSIKSLKNSNLDLAEKVLERDKKLDSLEMEIDDDCIRVIVTKQPAAIDLRFILAVLKINTDLERIGDLATNIANETLKLKGRPTLKPLVDLPHMSAITIEMIKNAFQSITDKDVQLAQTVIKRDTEVDEINIKVHRELFSFMNENHDAMTDALGLITVSKLIERIGDHATNIAEKSIYYIEGIDVRHSD